MLDDLHQNEHDRVQTSSVSCVLDSENESFTLPKYLDLAVDLEENPQLTIDSEFLLSHEREVDDEPRSPSFIVRACLSLIHLYRRYLSPLKPPSCRFTPTCSQYALDAYMHFGFFLGTWRTLTRLLRCHPWHPGGHDPVIKYAKNSRRRRSKDDPKQLMISLVAVVVFFSVWQSVFPPPVPVDSVSQEKLSGDHKLSDLTVEKIAGQVEGEATLSAQSPTSSPSIPLKPITRLHTLRDDNRFEVEFNSRGDIDQWSILESQYRHRLRRPRPHPIFYLLVSR